MEIYRDTAVPIIHKIVHVHRKGQTGFTHAHRNFTKDFGEIPIGSFNEETQKFEPCVNTRGRAYAARNRRIYLNKKTIPTD